MGRFAKYLGRMSISVDGELIALDKMTVEDVQKLMDASEAEEGNLVEGHKALMDIMKKALPEEPEDELKAFVLQKYPEITENILIGLGWVDKEQLDAKKQELLEKKKI